jgi:hypothetical protein
MHTGACQAFIIGFIAALLLLFSQLSLKKTV